MNLDTLLTELVLQGERIAELEDCLEQLKSQLLDTHAKDSVLITFINETLKK